MWQENYVKWFIELDKKILKKISFQEISNVLLKTILNEWFQFIYLQNVFFKWFDSIPFVFNLKKKIIYTYCIKRITKFQFGNKNYFYLLLP